MTKREKRAADPFLEQATMIAEAEDFLAHWPDAPAHPNPVTAAVVVEWFRDAFKRGPVPDEAAVRSLVHWLNFAGPWDTNDIKRLTTPPAGYKKLSEVIAMILEVAPGELETAEARSKENSGSDFIEYMQHEWHEKRARALRALLHGARVAAPVFPIISPGTKKQAPWKITAREAAKYIAAAMLRAGYQPPNFNGGPAVKVLQHAMEHLEGKPRALTQLRDAFRPDKKK